jgi:hypothetical protein
MNGAIPPFPNTPSGRGTQLKHRGNFTFTFTLIFLDTGWHQTLNNLDTKIKSRKNISQLNKSQ